MPVHAPLRWIPVSRWPWLTLVVAVALLALPQSAVAFTFKDGSTMVCVARGAAVLEVFAGPDDPFTRLNRIGLAERTEDGYRITWNQLRLQTLPPELHDFMFFHECAHATVPTESEPEANCAGLKAMRAAGRAGAAVETKLRAMFPHNAYWTETFACADRPEPAR